MKAVVFKEKCTVAVENVDDPTIEQPTDAVVKITTSAVCGSDLHMYEGRTGAEPGTVFGHENMGVVTQIGPGVTSVKVGDRVVLPFNIGCGFCYNCLRNYTSACLVVNPEQAHAAYGYAQMGPFKGGQAEYLRVPYADFNCLKLPGTPGDEWEDDFVLLADIWPTGYHGVELSGFQVGESIAIWGAGPVGLLAAYSAVLRGASETYVVDREPGRLKKAEGIGTIAINFADGDPVEQIMEHRRKNNLLQGSLRPGEEKMAGVMRGVDAVGYQARSDQDGGSKEDPMQTMKDLIRVVNPTGGIGVVGVYMSGDPGAVDEQAKQGIFPFPLASLFEKGLTVGTGQTPVKRYNEHLRELIVTGRAKPSFIISHRMPLDDAAQAYKDFDACGSEYTKIVLKPDLATANSR